MRRTTVLAVAAAGFYFLLSGLLGASYSLGPASVQAEDDPVVVGVVSFPQQKGVPFRSVSQPASLTYAAIFDTLTYINEQGIVEPWLAASWETSDYQTWTFTLRDDVLFSNGVTLTADSLVENIRIILEDTEGGDLAAQELSNIADAEAVGLGKVVITLTQPDPTFDRLASMVRVFEPGAWRDRGRTQFALQPVGTGPFRVDSWNDFELRLVANEASWIRPKVKALTIKVVPSESARLQGLVAGSLDIVFGLGPGDTSAVQHGGGRMMTANDAIVTGLIFQLVNGSGPLMDRRIRQALNYAVNKEAINAVLYEGEATIASQPGASSTFGHNPEIMPYPYDPERAKALLADAGYENGFAFSAELTPGGWPGDLVVYQVVANDLAKIGVDLTLINLPRLQLLTKYGGGNWDGEAMALAFAADTTLDALRPLRFHSCLWAAPWYCDDRIQPKIAAALSESQPLRRERLTQEIMSHYHEEATALFLFEVLRFIGLSSRVEDFEVVNGVSRFDLLTVRDH